MVGEGYVRYYADGFLTWRDMDYGQSRVGYQREIGIMAYAPTFAPDGEELISLEGVDVFEPGSYAVYYEPGQSPFPGNPGGWFAFADGVVQAP